jgi:hypothetical protein
LKVRRTFHLRSVSWWTPIGPKKAKTRNQF